MYGVPIISSDLKNRSDCVAPNAMFDLLISLRKPLGLTQVREALAALDAYIVQDDSALEQINIRIPARNVRRLANVSDDIKYVVEDVGLTPIYQMQY